MRSSSLRAAIRAVCGGTKRPPTYSGAPTTRPLDVKLEDAAWVGKAASTEAAFMLLDLKKNAAACNAAGHIAWVSAAEAETYGGGAKSHVLLGRRTADALPKSFLNERYARVAQDTYTFAAAVDSSAVKGKEWVGLRELVNSAPPAEASMAGQARNLLLWHKHHAFCGVCGGATASGKGGWKRECGSCGAQLFPRTDPVIISAVLSPDGERCLLGRQAKWPRGRFSCLAGFVDPGETLEEAVRREVYEEAGVVVGASDVYYHSSQPWPNGPAGQLMLGFLSVAESEGLAVDTAELETAQWVALDEVRAALAGGVTTAGGGGTGGGVGVDAGGLLLPVPSAIANQLLHAACDVHAVMSGQGGGGAGA